MRDRRAVIAERLSDWGVPIRPEVLLVPDDLDVVDVNALDEWLLEVGVIGVNELAVARGD